MSTSEEDRNLFAQFLDDYFAECDEHLTAIRQNILALESFINQPEIERSLLDRLFGSFHAIKGLSGMVGLKEAEQLAHEMESYLRSLRDLKVVLSQTGIDALISGVKILEQVINNYRIQAPIPDIAETIERLTAAFARNFSPPQEPESQPSIPDVSPTAAPHPKLPSLNLKPEEKKRIMAAIASGARAWLFQFSSAPEKAAKGINVNIIRQRLQSIGELIHAAPRVIENGGIVFDFVVTSQIDPATFKEWEPDGMTAVPYSLAEKNVAEETEASKSSNLARTAISNSLSTPSNVVRVDLFRLDELMRMVGELVITRARLEDNLKTLKNTIPASELRILRENTLTLERQLRDLREGVMRVRLVPIGELFARMQFAIRDLAKETQKQIGLELSGQTIEIDKFIVERMIDPLLHLVRNAASHGLEEEAERVAKGKPTQGKISLRAFTAGETVVIEVEDDGRGVDLEKVTKLAQEQGAKNAIGFPFTDSTDLTSNPIAVLDIICASGFSTKESADKISGRGVGMAVVKNTVQELGGSISLETTPGKGTKFSIQLPLTLSIADALIVSVADRIFAIPLSSVREVFQVKFSEITYLENNEIIAYRDRVIPIIRLRKIFNLKTETNAHPSESKNLDLAPSSFLYLVIVGNGLSAAGIAIDRILGQQEIAIRPLTDPLVQVVGIAGASELGDGRVALILDPLALIRIVIGNRQFQITNFS